MRAALVAWTLLFQAATPATLPHFRWGREVVPAAGAAGTTCAVLDAATFAHARSRALEDLRLYAGAEEVPYALTESSAAQESSDAARVQRVTASGSALAFDLAMPPRVYSEVDLQLPLKNFVATAEVTVPGSVPAQHLGTFTLFDLSAQHGARSTSLPLAEAGYPRIHVELRVRDLAGRPYPVSAASVAGALVPPAREAQTVYTTAAQTSDVRRDGRWSSASMDVPPHVPVERVRFDIDPAFHANFLRDVAVTDITQTPDAPVTAMGREEVSGQIFRETRDDGTAPPIHAQNLAFDAEFAANLHEPRTLGVRVDNGNAPPLPVRSIVLEMRQRRLCFQAAPGMHYTLRYGDNALDAPDYAYASLFHASAPAAEAQLGPEAEDPHWTPHPDTRPVLERRPEVFWIALLGIVALLGATALGNAKHQRRRGVQ